MLSTVADRCAGTVHADQFVESVVPFGGRRIPRVRENVFHVHSGGKENEEGKEIGECYGTGKESEHERERILTKILKEAR